MPSASAPIYESTPGSAAASLVVATDTRKAARQVGEILKARNAEREKIFSGVLALAAYIAAAGMVVIFIALASDFLGVFVVELGIFHYLAAVGYFIFEIGLILATTLPPETFDFDTAFDDRRGARRAVTIAVMLMTGLQGMSFPHAPWLGSLCFLVKLVWDESVAGGQWRQGWREWLGMGRGYCRCGAREKQHDAAAGEAPGFRDVQGRRVHNPIDAGCRARFRPRLTDTFSLCYYAIIGLHYGVRFAFSYGLCHAAADTRTCASRDANLTTATAERGFWNSRAMLGNVPNSTSITTCGGFGFKSV